VYGAELDGRNSAKGDLIAHILVTERIDPTRTVMIGDRSHDVVGATSNGVAAVGVLWGYGDRAELEGAGAARIAARPQELPEIVRALLGRA
jgi:phosphoglycolate phosphatase